MKITPSVEFRSELKEKPIDNVSFKSSRNSGSSDIAINPVKVSPDIAAANLGISFKGVSEKKLNTDLQAGLNRKLNDNIDASFNKGDTQPLVDFANALMPAITSVSKKETVNGDIKTETVNGVTTLAKLSNGETELKIGKEYGIRLYRDGKEITTNKDNIPFHYPWFEHDPKDKRKVEGTDISIADYAATHVARGTRWADPWHEKNWPQVKGITQGDQNWPPSERAFGPYKIDMIGKPGQKALTMSLPPDEEGKVKPNAYGVIPRSIYAVNPDSSIVMAVQHENHNDKFNWSPWFVLGFATPKGSVTDPTMLFAYPDKEGEVKPYNPDKTWNYLDVAGEKVALINPHAKTLNEPFKKLHSGTNWSVVAEKGSKDIILTRSVLRHDEQYFPFLEHGKYFIEAEHTGPSVGKGQKGALVVKHDFVPVKDLIGKETLSSEQGDFRKDVQEIIKVLVEKDKKGELISVYKGTGLNADNAKKIIKN